MEKQTFNIEVCRTGFGFATIPVEAHTEEEAEQLALDEAGDHDYSEKDAEYDLCSSPRQRGDLVTIEKRSETYFILCITREGETPDSTIYVQISKEQRDLMVECGISEIDKVA